MLYENSEQAADVSCALYLLLPDTTLSCLSCFILSVRSLTHKKEQTNILLSQGEENKKRNSACVGFSVLNAKKASVL